jgi:hypothetical protein
VGMTWANRAWGSGSMCWLHWYFGNAELLR